MLKVSKKRLFLLVGLIATAFCIWLGLLSWFSWQAVASFQRAEFAPAQSNAQIATVLFWPLKVSVGQLNADVSLYGQSLQLLNKSARLAQQLQQYFPATLAGEKPATELASQISNQLSPFQTDLEKWLTTYQKAKFLPSIMRRHLPAPLGSQFLDNPNQLNHHSKDVIAAIQYLLAGDHRLIFLLQNSDELRATGGFMGSYALLELKDGVVQQFKIQDIYVPDGQFSGYVDAPPGVSEYLSGGKGLRLPDANWSPDFPSAAQQISQFFALGNEKNIEGVVAINLNVVEELLQLTGPIYLPDSQQTVTPENLFILARADREQFFPGSQQKSEFLNQVLRQLKIQLAAVFSQKKGAFFELLQRMIATKQIQSFSRATPLQQVFTDLHSDGQVFTQATDRYFFLIESNVGINKANRLVTRNVALQLLPRQSSVHIFFTNQNPPTTLKAERGEYINYQRILVPPTYQVQKITVNNQLLPKWDEQLVTTYSGEKLKQVGFLITIPAQSAREVVIEFNHPDLPLFPLVIQKQSGLPPTPYHLQTQLHPQTPTQTQDFLLEQDVIMKHP